MRPKCIDQRGPLPDQQIAGPVKHQYRLLVDTLTATNRIVGLVTASQNGSVSAASVFPRFTKALRRQAA
ncbi:hypothetical protein [Polymorphobacter fuscus]|uniref:hypothetical protein n=1 Tax=Sandarakinorhabdus fusca TaxID=1439888 RepID=UPI003C712CE8